MLNFRLTGVVLAAGLLAASCSNDAQEIQLIQEPGTVSLAVSPNVVSRVSTDGNTTTFEENDKIIVHSTGLLNDMNNVTFTVGSDKKTLTSGSEYYYKGSNSATFYAFYPTNAAAESDTKSVTFTVSTDQRTKDAHAQNDFMTASCIRPASGAATLQFAHQLAWVKVTIDGASPSAITMNNVKPSATYQFSDNTVTAGGTEGSINMGKHETEFWVLIPAQAFTNGTELLSITVDSDSGNGAETYAFTPSSDITFNTGEIKTISITIADGVVLETGISVTDWAEGDKVEGIIKK